MQTVDNSLRVVRRRGVFGARLTTAPGHGEPNPTYIPVANAAARRAARLLGGEPMSSLNEAVLDIPMTAHFIGGCPIGATAETGVVDPWHRLFGLAGLHIADGSVVPANLGVNPSLTITALAERAMAVWPNRGDPDPRPPLGEPYRHVARQWPRHLAVPEGAAGALAEVSVDAPRRVGGPESGA